MFRQSLPRGKAGWGKDAFSWCGYAQPGRVKAVLGDKEKMSPSLTISSTKCPNYSKTLFPGSSGRSGETKECGYKQLFCLRFRVSVFSAFHLRLQEE